MSRNDQMAAVCQYIDAFNEGDAKVMATTFTVPRHGAGSNAPRCGELAQRHRKDRAGLRNLLGLHFERHGRGNNHISAIPGDVVMQWLAHSDEIV